MAKKVPQHSDHWIIKNIVAAAVVIFVLVCIANLVLGIVTKHNREISVPDFTNMTLSEASATARANGVRIEVVDSVFVRRMQRGSVYRQNPTPGSAVKDGRRILLTINATTPKKVTMPNLIGCTMRQAKAELVSRGLVLGKLIYVSDIATNNVLRQLKGNVEIKPGRQVEGETVINLVVGLSHEDCMTSVPDVRGMKNMTAVDAVHDYSLNIRKLAFDASVKNYSDSLNAVVYKQSPDATSEPLTMGSDVTLYLSVDPTKISK